MEPTKPSRGMQGWELARDHALTAVGTDNQMRIWYSDSPAYEGGLLFKCALGSVDLDSPVGASPRQPWLGDRGHGEWLHETADDGGRTCAILMPHSQARAPGAGMLRLDPITWRTCCSRAAQSQRA